MTETQKQVLEWLSDGSVGLSSKTMAMYLAFDTATRMRSHPHDPDDLDRCLRLLDRAPGLRESLKKMADLSDVWKALIDRWDEIEASHLDEVGLGWSKAMRAPKTYALMRSVIQNAETSNDTSAGGREA